MDRREFTFKDTPAEVRVDENDRVEVLVKGKVVLRGQYIRGNVENARGFMAADQELLLATDKVLASLGPPAN